MHPSINPSEGEPTVPTPPDAGTYYVEAERLFKLAAKIKQSFCPPDDPQLVVVYNNLAATLDKRGAPAKAKPNPYPYHPNPNPCPNPNSNPRPNPHPCS